MANAYALILTNDDQNSADLRAQLIQAQWDCGVTTDLVKAWRFLSRHRATVIFVDYRNVAGIGLRVLQMLAENGIQAPVIYVSQSEDMPDSVQAMERGAFDVLARPVTQESLLRALGQIVLSV